MKVNVQWQGDLLFKGVTEQGHELKLDGNKQTAATPMEAILVAAASCSSVDVVSILQKSRQQFSDVQVEVTGERADAVPAVFTDIHLHFKVTGSDVSEKQVERAVNLSADKYCSVAIMLSSSVNITHSFEVIAE
ncbi:OsmC family protein [Neptunicella marina]|uniref:OsmC family protein n=1 Tax=Neptunicella marina TaxID=2125989 RepID=A0A8J6ISB0_9ALTE|nr:OsmC family protein [Neptunicella marina]MBC3765856.1 OsmC family protein [Neptunicella marina]